MIELPQRPDRIFFDEDLSNFKLSVATAKIGGENGSLQGRNASWHLDEDNNLWLSKGQRREEGWGYAEGSESSTTGSMSIYFSLSKKPPYIEEVRASGESIGLDLQGIAIGFWSVRRRVGQNPAYTVIKAEECDVDVLAMKLTGGTLSLQSTSVSNPNSYVVLDECRQQIDPRGKTMNLAYLSGTACGPFFEAR
jgi:hypothetical protein